MLFAMDELQKNDSHFPTPLLHLTYLLQQSSDELLTSGVGAGLSSVRVMSALHPRVARSQLVVAKMLRQTESSVSRQLHNMKKQGLVTVTKNKKDGRQRDVTLTAKGHRTFVKAKKLLDKQQKSLSKSDQKALEQTAGKVLRAI